MNILELYAAIKAKDWKALMRMAGELLIQMSGSAPMLATSSEPTESDIVSLEVALKAAAEEAKADTVVMASPKPEAVDPVLVITIVLQILEAWKAWKKK